MTIQVKVKPNSREESLEDSGDGHWLAKVKAPPIDGKANRALVDLVARRFGAPKASVEIRNGTSGRLKLVRITA